jgi:hypothetical protein
MIQLLFLTRERHSSENKSVAMIWIGTAVFLFGLIFRALGHERLTVPGPLHD